MTTPADPAAFNGRLRFEGWNKEGDIEKIGTTSFRFHSTMKAIAYMIVRKLPAGTDKYPIRKSVLALIYRVARLIPKANGDWLDRLDGVAAVNRDIYREYLIVEGQQWRKDIMERVGPFSLSLTGGDINWTEMTEWWVFQLIRAHEEGRLLFNPLYCDPENWFSDQKRCRMAIPGGFLSAVRINYWQIKSIEYLSREMHEWPVLKQYSADRKTMQFTARYSPCMTTGCPCMGEPWNDKGGIRNAVFWCPYLQEGTIRGCPAGARMEVLNTDGEWIEVKS